MKRILQRLRASWSRRIAEIKTGVPQTADPLAGGAKFPSYLTRFDEEGAISFHMPHELVLHGVGPRGVNRKSWVYEQLVGCVGEKIADIVIDSVQYEETRPGFDWSLVFMVYTKVQEPFGKLVKMN